MDGRPEMGVGLFAPHIVTRISSAVVVQDLESARYDSALAKLNNARFPPLSFCLPFLFSQTHSLSLLYLMSLDVIRAPPKCIFSYNFRVLHKHTHTLSLSLTPVKRLVAVL